jgi:hypothetical protein
MPDFHAAAPICLPFFGMKTHVNDNYLLERVSGFMEKTVLCLGICIHWEAGA